MKKKEFVEDEIEDVPVSPRLCEQRNKYGSVPGLDDEELAAPEELERQIMLQEWGPVLMLPVRGKHGGFLPEVDEHGMDVDAFGTVDFARTMPEFDKARYKAEKLKEKLRDVLMMLDTVKDRLPGTATFRVLKYLRMGIIEEEHIANEDVLAMAKLIARAGRIQREIVELRKLSWKRREAARRQRLRRLEL